MNPWWSRPAPEEKPRSLQTNEDDDFNEEDDDEPKPAAQRATRGDRHQPHGAPSKGPAAGPAASGDAPREAGSRDSGPPRRRGGRRRNGGATTGADGATNAPDRMAPAKTERREPGAMSTRARGSSEAPLLIDIAWLAAQLELEGLPLDAVVAGWFDRIDHSPARRRAYGPREQYADLCDELEELEIDVVDSFDEQTARIEMSLDAQELGRSAGKVWLGTDEEAMAPLVPRLSRSDIRTAFLALSRPNRETSGGRGRRGGRGERQAGGDRNEPSSHARDSAPVSRETEAPQVDSAEAGRSRQRQARSEESSPGEREGRRPRAERAQRPERTERSERAERSVRTDHLDARPPERSGASAASRAPRDGSPSEAPFEWLQQAISALLEEQPRLVWGTLVRQEVLRQHDTFDERTYGYATFNEFLAAAAEAGEIELVNDARTGSCVVNAWRP